MHTLRLCYLAASCVKVLTQFTSRARAARGTASRSLAHAHARIAISLSLFTFDTTICNKSEQSERGVGGSLRRFLMPKNIRDKAKSSMKCGNGAFHMQSQNKNGVGVERVELIRPTHTQHHKQCETKAPLWLTVLGPVGTQTKCRVGEGGKGIIWVRSGQVRSG